MIKLRLNTPHHPVCGSKERAQFIDAAATPPRRGGECLPLQTPAADGTRLSFKLLLLFLLFLYANPSLLVPALEAVRPAQAAAAAAIIMVFIERFSSGQSFKLVWPDSYLLLAFFAAAGLSTFSAFWMLHAVEATLDLGRIVLVYFVIVNTVNNVNRLRTAVLLIVAGGLFPAAGAINSYLRGDLVEGTRAHWIGVFANPNELAYCLVILVPAAAALAADARPAVRMALWGTIGVYAAAIYLTYSRGGLLGLFAVLGLMVVRQRSISVRVVAVALAAASIIFMSYFWERDTGSNDISQDYTVQQRIATIKAGIGMFLDHPLLGVGIDCSIIAYPLYEPDDFHFKGSLVIHNTIVQALSETGAAGFVPFAMLILAGLQRARKTAARAAGSGHPALAHLAGGMGVSLVGFIVCGFSGGYVTSWFPYIFLGLISSTDGIHA